MKLPESRRCPKKNAGLVHKGRIKIKTMGRDGVVLNHENIDLRYVEQLADSEQLTCLGYLLRYMEEQDAVRDHMTSNGRVEPAPVGDRMEKDGRHEGKIQKEGVTIILDKGSVSIFRLEELMEPGSD